VELGTLRPDQARATGSAALMADHSHSPMSKKVLVAVGGQGIDPETVRLACRMTDPQGGRLYGVHIIEVNRSLPLGAVLDEVVERGEKILEEVEQLAAETLLPVETELVQARDTGPALVDEAVEWGADLIVMGLPYKRRFGEFNLGKTVPYVLKNATCRVMLFREHREHSV
jgi:nucleotide-binding universal stress UspA family protein